MVVGAERGVAHLREQLPERRLLLQPRAQDEGVDEEADERLGLTETAAGDGGADDDIVLAAVAGQHGLEGGQQRHEGGDALLLAELRELAGGLRGELEAGDGAAEGLHRGTREVRGQLQRPGDAREPLLPIAELLLQRFALEPRALPHREVAILERRLGQRRGLTRGEGLVQRRHLPHHLSQGPAVRDDVVHGQHQHVLGGREPHEHHPQQRPARQLEGPDRLLRGQPVRLGLAVLVAGEVHDVQREGAGRLEVLHRGATLVAEGGAERLVTSQQLGEGALQGLDVQLPVQAQGHRHVVVGRAGLELVQEPQALLAEGHGQRLARPRYRHQVRQ